MADRPAFDEIAREIASFLHKWEDSDQLYLEGARAVLASVLSHKRIHEALGKAMESDR
jgi:hypothetical protein